MTQQIIQIGTAPNDGTGDPLRTSFEKTNANFTELYGAATDGTVTSVNVSAGTTGLTATGGPITGSGTITLGGVLNVASGGTGGTTSLGTAAYKNTGTSGNTVPLLDGQNAFSGNTRMGSTAAPTVALDVTGSIFSSMSLRVGAGTVGKVGLAPATDGNNSGYIELFNGSSVRVGYIGFVPLAGGPIAYNNEVGFGHQFGGQIVCDKTIQTGVYTVATLPSAAASGAASRAYVSDANSAAFASPVVTGGSNTVPVYTNGTVWIIG